MAHTRTALMLTVGPSRVRGRTLAVAGSSSSWGCTRSVMLSCMHPRN